MKTLYKEPLPPRQLFIKNKDGELVELPHHACAHCGIIHSNAEFAKSCCQQRYCDSCGTEVEKHWILCRSCREAMIMQKAELVDEKTYDGPVYCEATETFFSDLGELYDQVEPGDLPECVYACKKAAVSDLDAANIATRVIESIFEDHHEDAQADDVEGLEAAIGAWLKKQTAVSWDVDNKRKIKVRIEDEETDLCDSERPDVGCSPDGPGQPGSSDAPDSGGPAEG